MNNIKILICFSCFVIVNYLHAQVPSFGDWKVISKNKTKSSVTKTRNCGTVTIVYNQDITEVQRNKIGDSIFKKISHIEITKTFNAAGTTEITRLTGIDYIREYNKDSIILVQFNNLTSAYTDALEISKSDAGKVYSPPPPPNTLLRFPIILSTKRFPAYTKQQRRQEFEKAAYTKRNNAILFVGLSLTPSVAYRQLLIDTPFFSNNSLYHLRHNNESSIIGWVVTGKAGITLYKSHLIYAEGGFIKQGFKSKGYKIDSISGLPVVNASEERNNAFNNTIIGIGYSYKPYNVNKKINIATDIGIYGITKSIKSLNNISMCGLKVGLGITIKSNYWSEVKIMPTLYYNLNTDGRTQLKTRLYNVGLTIEFGWNTVKGRYYKK